jgi:hypothetical protein
MPKIARNLKAIKNIVLLLVFPLVLLYYSTLHEGLVPNTFRCQEKNTRAISIFLGGIAISGLLYSATAMGCEPPPKQ